MQQIEIKNCYVHDFTLPLMTASIQMEAGVTVFTFITINSKILVQRTTPCLGVTSTPAHRTMFWSKKTFSPESSTAFGRILQTPYPVTNWVIRDNRIEINRYLSSGGIELRGLNTTIKNILIERNFISSRVGRSLSGFGIALAKVSGGILRHNVIDGMKGPTHIVSKSVAGVELYDNRKQDRTTIRASSLAQISATPNAGLKSR